MLTTAVSLFQPLLMRDLDATRFELQLTSGMSNAAYAFGAVASADIAQRLSRRQIYLVCEAGFVVSTLLALGAHGIAPFMAGVVLQGLFTGMLLVVALPPLVTAHGVERLPTTAAVISLGLFGMVTAGPVAGGLVGSMGGWRLLYASIAVLAAVGLTVGAMTFEGNEPPDRRAAFDWLAIPLAFGATALPFFGVSWLSRGSFHHPAFLAPVVVGPAIGAVLVVGQYRKENPLMPVRPISNTLPVTGTLNAMVVGASFTTLLELVEAYLLQVRHFSPVRTGLLIAPQILGVVVASLLFRRVLTTRWTPYLALSGLVSVAVGAGVLLAVTPSNTSPVVVVAALFLGYGAGAGVAPGLFLAGFSVSASQLGPTLRPGRTPALRGGVPGRAGAAAPRDDRGLAHARLPPRRGDHAGDHPRRRGAPGRALLAGRCLPPGARPRLLDGRHRDRLPFPAAGRAGPEERRPVAGCAPPAG